MPLIKGKSQSVFNHNVRVEMNSGKPQNQSLAIAYGLKKRAAKRMSQGGQVDDVPEPDKKNAEEFEKGATESGYQPERWLSNLKEGLGLDDKKKPQHYSNGGLVDQIMNKRKEALPEEGNMPEDDSDMFDEQEDDYNNQDFLSDEEQDSLPEDESAKRSRLISGIMSSLHKRHYGR